MCARPLALLGLICALHKRNPPRVRTLNSNSTRDYILPKDGVSMNQCPFRPSAPLLESKLHGAPLARTIVPIATASPAWYSLKAGILARKILTLRISQTLSTPVDNFITCGFHIRKRNTTGFSESRSCIQASCVFSRKGCLYTTA